MLKIVQGKLTAGVSAVNATTGETVHIGKLLKLTGKKQEEISEALAGDIAAVTKLEASTNDTLCAPEAVAALAPTEFPQACYFRAVNLAGGGDEGKLSGAIRRLLEEDPTLKYVHNHETHQRMIGGLGDQHLDVAAAKLKSKFGMEVKMSEPKIAYREAIRKPVTIESKYKKQSGGHGQYGHVKIEFESYDGDELMFCEKVFGGAVRRTSSRSRRDSRRPQSTLHRRIPGSAPEGDPHRRKLPPGRQLRNGVQDRSLDGVQGLHEGGSALPA
ncbi:MAG: hypothetical protein ACLSG5_08520 [Oscillospiraceae bacterium]